MTKEQNEKMAIIRKVLECSVCRRYVATLMVMPWRGNPTDEDVRLQSEQQGKEIRAFEMKHRKHLIEHGLMKGD